MSAAAAWREYPEEFAADMQQHYGVNVETAAAEGFSAWHIAVLASQLPHDCRIRKAADADSMWSLESVLLAMVANDQRHYIWMQGDPATRGPKPKMVGPSWMTAGDVRSLPARALPVSKLMGELSKPRRA